MISGLAIITQPSRLPGRFGRRIKTPLTIEIHGAAAILLPWRALIDAEDAETVLGFPWRLETKSGLNYLVTGSRHIQMARLLIEIPPGKVPDHRNGNPLDNRKENLRIATQGENRFNAAKMRRAGTSQYKGVRFHSRAGKYCASICPEVQVVIRQARPHWWGEHDLNSAALIVALRNAAPAIIATLRALAGRIDMLESCKCAECKLIVSAADMWIGEGK